MIKNFVDVLKNKYVSFKGRADRKEFWLFWLVIVIVEIIFFVILNLVANAVGFGVFYWILSAILWCFLLAMFLPMLGVLIRRLQDTGRKWTWIFIGLIPIIGGVWLLVLLASKSQEGPNQFDE